MAADVDKELQSSLGCLFERVGSGLMRNLFLACVALLTMLPAARAADTEVSVRPMYFRWKETIPSRKPITEHGWLYSAGMSKVLVVADHLYVSARVELWGGRIDYDGYTAQGWVPYKTDTDYLGTHGELTFGATFPLSETVAFKPFIGAGHKFWLRSRSNESWNTLFGRLGGQLRFRLGDTWAFVETGALVPAYTRLHIDWSSAAMGDVVLEPKSVASPFASAGLEFGRVSLSLIYEQMKFGKSESVSVNKTAGPTGAVLDNSFAYQPDSASSTIGIRMQYRF